MADPKQEKVALEGVFNRNKLDQTADAASQLTLIEKVKNKVDQNIQEGLTQSATARAKKSLTTGKNQPSEDVSKTPASTSIRPKGR